MKRNVLQQVSLSLFSVLFALVCVSRFSTAALAQDSGLYGSYKSALEASGKYDHYFLYDLTGDGIPELFVFSMKSMADMHYRVYSYDGTSRRRLSDIPTSHGGIDVDVYGNMYVVGAHMYSYWVNKVSYNGTDVVVTDLFECDYDESAAMRAAYGIGERQDIPTYHRGDDSGLLLANSAALGQAGAGTGWAKDAHGWRYRNEDGSYPASQWLLLGDKWYYFLSDGYMAENQWVGGLYYVGADGAMLTNTVTPDGYPVGADGKWIAGNGSG